MATPTDDDNADDCISGNYYGYERGGTLGRVEKRKLCDIARQFFVWQGSEDAVVAELRQVFADADRRKNGRCSVQVEFINTP